MPLLAPDALVVVPTPAPTASSGCEYDAALLGRLAGPALATLSTAERYSARRRRVGQRGGGTPDGRGVRPLRAGLRRRARPGRVGDPAERAGLDRSLRRGRHPGALPRLRAGARGARPRATRLAAGRRRGRPHRRAARHVDPRARPTSATIPRPSTRPAACTPPRWPIPGRSIPPSPRPLLSIVSANGGEADYEAGLARYRASHHPQDQRRELMALSEFRDAALFDRHAGAGHHRRRAHPGRTDAARALHRPPRSRRRWRGASCASAGTRLNARFPSNLMIRIVEPVPRLTRPQEQADVAGFLAEHPAPAGGQAGRAGARTPGRQRGAAPARGAGARRRVRVARDGAGLRRRADGGPARLAGAAGGPPRGGRRRPTVAGRRRRRARRRRDRRPRAGAPRSTVTLDGRPSPRPRR